ncbi:hypothetical protein ACF0H5_005465 [Mactra antiquata]
MGDSIKLVKMKQYAMSRLSSSEEISLPKQNGATNGGTHIILTPPTTPTRDNGFIPNKEYGDWDTATSPTKETMTQSTVSPQQRQSRSRPGSGKPAQKFIPEHEIEIPADGSLRDFTTDDMSTFLRYLSVEERIVSHVHKKGLDGHKFSKLKDSDLDALGMKNPIICHFRDKSLKEKGGKKKPAFML